MKVIKRNCIYEDFNRDKIASAILKAMQNGSGIVKTNIALEIADEIYEENNGIAEMSISEIESLVFDKLIKKEQHLTAKAYEGYRSIREFQRDYENTTDDSVLKLIDGTNNYLNKENSNKNPILNTTQRDYMAGEVSKDLSYRLLLPPEVVLADKEGIIHFHDGDYYAQKMHNCDLINLEDMLQNGTVISGTLIEKPNSFSTACNIATQIIAQVASSQYGGQSISLAHLAPFVDVSRKKICEEIIEENKLIGILLSDEEVDIIAEKRLLKEIRKGVQTIQYQVVTLMTTNGQAPFLTVFMYLNETKSEQEKKDLALVIEETLKQRIQGVKNEEGVWITPAFPKLIYVLQEDNANEGTEYYYLTELAAKCTTKRLVPDYISEKKMKELKEGNCFPVMGCVDGKEIISYRHLNKLYVESFERMWDRLSDTFEIKHQYSEDSDNLYMDLSDVEIYDTEQGFTNTKRIIRNVSDSWIDVHFSNGRRLLCTTDHPFEINNKGVVKAEELSIGDKLIINSNQVNDERIVFNKDKAWFLGFMLCDGCYQNNSLFASIAATGEDEIESKFAFIVNKYFNLETETILQERGSKGTYKDLIIRSDNNGGIQKVGSYLNNKFGGINKANRHIPNEVFEWDYESKLAFLAGMIDADGYINPTSHGGSVVQIGSTNKELALQQMALAQSLGMPAKVYHNRYTKINPNLIRYRVEFYPIEELLTYITCNKKLDKYIPSNGNHYNTNAEVIGLTPIEKTAYSYDVTTESEHFEVSGLYSHNCRSALSPWKDENGNYKFYGRFNQGVVTINLVDVALSSGGDMGKFWSLIEERTELCHRALLCRHKRLEGTPSDVAPILWQHGALARLEKHEPITKLLHGGYSTISLGYAGLYECVKYMTGNSHTDDGIGFKLAEDVMKKLNEKCEVWKQEDDIGYGVYGSPIESTTYKFAKCLKKRFGVIEGVTDRDYITNSYHVPVFEEIDPFKKLELEAKLQALSGGGAISYIECCDLSPNIKIVLEIIKFIYHNIMYAELNTKSDYCQVCGFDGEIKIIEEDGKLIWECPNCKNRNQEKMNVARRTCGYVGSYFWNEGRTQEIKERYVHVDNHDFEDGDCN